MANDDPGDESLFARIQRRSPRVALIVTILVAFGAVVGWIAQLVSNGHTIISGLAPAGSAPPQQLQAAAAPPGNQAAPQPSTKPQEQPQQAEQAQQAPQSHLPSACDASQMVGRWHCGGAPGVCTPGHSSEQLVSNGDGTYTYIDGLGNRASFSVANYVAVLKFETGFQYTATVSQSCETMTFDATHYDTKQP